MLLLLLFQLNLVASAHNKSDCSVLPSVKCPWGLVSMTKLQCEKGFKHIACGMTLQRGFNREWNIDREARLSNVRKTKPDQFVCWKRTEEKLQVFCPDNEECEKLPIDDILKVCKAEDATQTLPSGSSQACSKPHIKSMCNGVAASITKEECEKGYHYLYCGHSAVKEEGQWKFTGRSKHFLYGGIPEPCRIVNESSLVAMCLEGNCDEQLAKMLDFCSSKIDVPEPTTTKRPAYDNGPIKQDWFHSEDDLLNNMVEIEEKSVEVSHHIPIEVEKIEEDEVESATLDSLASRLSRHERKSDPILELLNRDLALQDRNDLTLQGIAQNLIELTQLVQNISTSVKKLEEEKEQNEAIANRPVSFGPNFKAFKNCSIIIGSILAIAFILWLLKKCKKEIRDRTPLPDLTPIENGEGNGASLQVLSSSDPARLSLLRIDVPPQRRSALLIRDETDSANRKSFFLEDNNMQSIIAEARDMQLRENHESQM